MSRASWPRALTGTITVALVITTWAVSPVPAGASTGPESAGSLPAVPPAGSTTDTGAGVPSGVVAEVSGVVAEVGGVVADIVPRTATFDGALTTEGETDFTLLSDVYFAFGSAVLEPRALQDLQPVAERARAAGVKSLVVVGHTDAIGSDVDNQALSEARAQAVLDALAPLLDGVALTAEGRGETEPVAEETRDGADFPEGRALNRRVMVSPPG